MRTSSNSPLLIAEVSLPAPEGRLGLTLCPGKKDPYGDWERDLDTDLAIIRDWGAGTVVTLIEDHEFAMLDVVELGRRVRQLGMDWMHLPIRDVDVPDERFAECWPLARALLHARLDHGERILIHCRGGIGRTGLVAARLLVERGAEPRAAIRRVRNARPGAIETPDQERHVLDCRPVARVDAWVQRRQASLLAGALGDAVGYLVEFDSLAEIRRKYGVDGVRLHRLEPETLVVSDDTQMTLFTLEGLLAARVAGAVTPEAVEPFLRDAYLDWYGTQARTTRAPAGRLALDPLLHHRRAPGNTCLSALRQGGGTWPHPVNDSKGCGTVMRTAPCGWFREWNIEDAFAIGMRASALTHGHPTGIIAGGAMAAIVRAAMEGAPLRAAARTAIELASRHPGHGETASAIEAALTLAESTAMPSPETVATLGEGWVAEEALAIGLYAAIRGTTLEEAIELATNHSGDSDSTASIAGQLRGAEGIGGVPFALLGTLDVLTATLAIGSLGGGIAAM